MNLYLKFLKLVLFKLKILFFYASVLQLYASLAQEIDSHKNDWKIVLTEKIKKLRTNNGLEFCNSEIFTYHAYAHFNNGKLFLNGSFMYLLLNVDDMLIACHDNLDGLGNIFNDIFCYFVVGQFS
ncbi:hypothetical protein ACJX0J_015619, partial [Zea mays]